MKLLKALATTLVVALIGFGIAASLSGCGVKPQPLTPAQIAAVACPQLNLVHTQLSALNAALKADPKTAAIGATAEAKLDLAHGVVTKVCNGAAAAPTVDASSIQALVQTGLPALGYLAGALPIPPAQQAQIQAALVVAETAAGVAGVVEQQIKAAKSAAASPSTTATQYQSRVQEIAAISAEGDSLTKQINETSDLQAALQLNSRHQQLNERMSLLLHEQNVADDSIFAAASR